MSSLRRKTSNVESVRVVGTALVSTPVGNVSAVDGISFSDLLGKAGDGSRRAGNAYTPGDATSKRFGAEAQTPQVKPLTYPLWNNDGTDLYEQLDTLLREKSMLIAVV